MNNIVNEYQLLESLSLSFNESKDQFEILGPDSETMEKLWTVLVSNRQSEPMMEMTNRTSEQLAVLYIKQTFGIYIFPNDSEFNKPAFVWLSL